MARQVGRLSALAVSRANSKAMLADGGGLWLQVTASGAKSWLFRFMLNGRSREMGLGPLHTVSLAEARQAALRCRKETLAGVDPIEARRSERAGALLKASQALTFDQAAAAYRDAHDAGWPNKKHADQWTSSLAAYARPVIGNVPVQQIDTAMVLRVLEPIWSTKTETASRVRGRIEAVLDFAAARGQRAGDNPARWRGHLDQLLPARTRVRKVVHHPALPYRELATFMGALDQQRGTAAAALRFLILTATRTSEVLGVEWPETDLKAALWTIPAERMKARREHRVPLSADSVGLLEARRGDLLATPFVFSGGKAGKPLSNMALLALLRRMGRADITAHGFRSSFRDWAAEETSYPREVAEMALAHTIPDKVEAAYRQGDLFEKRQRMMADWARYCSLDEQDGGVERPASSRDTSTHG